MAAPDAWLVTLSFCRRGGRRFVVELRGAQWTIGRASANDIVVRSAAVAKHHQLLSVHEGVLVIEDQCSPGGTYVDGKRVGRPVALRLGSVVHIADAVYGLADGPTPITSDQVAAPRWLDGAPWDTEPVGP